MGKEHFCFLGGLFFSSGVKKEMGGKNEEGGARNWSTGLRDSSPSTNETGNDKRGSSKTCPKAVWTLWGLQMVQPWTAGTAPARTPSSENMQNVLSVN